MEFIYQIEDRLLDELKEVSQKIGNGEEITSQCLDDIKDISESLNNFSTYMAMKESGFSHNSSYGMDNGMSNRAQMRDSRGRYSRGAGYSRGNRMMDEWGREPYGMY